MFFGSIASSVVVIIRKLCFLEQIQSKTSLCVVFESCYTSLIFIIASATKKFEMHLLVLFLLFKYLVIHLKIFARWNCQNWRMHFSTLLWSYVSHPVSSQLFSYLLYIGIVSIIFNRLVFIQLIVKYQRIYYTLATISEHSYLEIFWDWIGPGRFVFWRIMYQNCFFNSCQLNVS